MPRPVFGDLASFRNWLIETRSISRRSASVYTSTIRRILNDLSDITDHVLLVFINRPENLKSRELIISSWSRFHEYTLEERGLRLPVIESGSKSKSKRSTIPTELLILAVFLKKSRNITYSKMIDLKWADVKPLIGEFWEISIDGSICNVPSNIMRSACDKMFRYEDINEGNPLFASLQNKSQKVSRSKLSISIKKFFAESEQVHLHLI